MSDLPTKITEAVNAHRVSAFSGDDTACSCDRTWRTNLMHRVHLSEALAAMLAPVVETIRADVWDEGHRTGQNDQIYADTHDRWATDTPNPYRKES